MTRRVPESERIYIDEVSKIIDRSSRILKIWEKEGTLPQDLMPSRGRHRKRYWSREQVEGIIEWMGSNEHEEKRIKGMRAPKHINRYHLMAAKKMADDGKSAREIAEHVNKLHYRRSDADDEIVRYTGLGYPLLKNWYTSVDNVERALRRCFELRDWPFPDPEREASIEAQAEFVPPVSLEQARKQKEKNGGKETQEESKASP